MDLPQPGKDLAADVLLVHNIKNNSGVLGFNRTFASLIAGIATGIAGITGWQGFTWYFLSHAVMSVLLLGKARFRPQLYFKQMHSLFLEGVFDSTALLTFILFWTFAHNFVHLF